MSQIVTTKLGRFRRVNTGDIANPDAWLFECPCGQWSYLDDDMWHGRVSVDHASEGCPKGYHETHDYAAELIATMQAHVLMGDPSIDAEKSND